MDDIIAGMAGCLFLLVCAATAVAGLIYSIKNSDNIRSVFSRQVIGGIIATLLLTLAGTAACVATFASDLIPVEMLASCVVMVFLGIMALCVLPMGILLDREERRAMKPRFGEQLILPIAIVVMLALSYGYVFGLIMLLESMGIEVTINPMMLELTESPIAMLAFFPIALAAAFIEETIFRLGIQGGLQKCFRHFDISVGKYAVPVVITSVLFALGHSGYISPPGIKESQIFMVGLILGWLKVQYGARGCIAGHLGLNFFAMLFGFLFPEMNV